MAAWYIPITVGSKSTFAGHASDLGNVYQVGAKSYVLVKAAAAITSCGRFALSTALDGTTKLPTYAMNTTTTANDETVLGVCDASQVDLATGDFFMLQCSGPAEIQSAAAIAAHALVGSSTTAGKCDDASITAGVGAIGVALESAAGADEHTAVLLSRRF